MTIEMISKLIMLIPNDEAVGDEREHAQEHANGDHLGELLSPEAHDFADHHPPGQQREAQRGLFQFVLSFVSHGRECSWLHARLTTANLEAT